MKKDKSIDKFEFDKKKYLSRKNRRKMIKNIEKNIDKATGKYYVNEKQIEQNMDSNRINKEYRRKIKKERQEKKRLKRLGIA